MLTVQTPCSRGTDPETSHLAESHINRSGLRSHQQRQAAAAVSCYRGGRALSLLRLRGSIAIVWRNVCQSARPQAPFVGEISDSAPFRI